MASKAFGSIRAVVSVYVLRIIVNAQRKMPSPLSLGRNRIVASAEFECAQVQRVKTELIIIFHLHEGSVNIEQ